jgi:transcriptional regulator with XRE-family HTH domain
VAKTNPVKSALPQRELEINARLREVRRFLRLTQTEFADQLGIKRTRLASYEEGRAPLRWEIALRACQQFQIGEKWLATGLHITHRGKKALPFDNSIIRSSMILPTDIIVQKLPHGALFSEVFDRVLGNEYNRLLIGCGPFFFRAQFSESDNAERLHNHLDWAVRQWRSMIPRQRWARFYAELIRCAVLLYHELSLGPDDEPLEISDFEKLIEREVVRSGIFKRQSRHQK